VRRAQACRLAAALALWLAGCAPLAPPKAPAPAPTPWLRVLGTAQVAPGTDEGGQTFGGISGIDRDPATDEYLLVSDARGARGAARVYTARLRYHAHGMAAPEITGVRLLRDVGGAPFAGARGARAGAQAPDAEAVRWLPGAAQFLWTDEGNFARGFGPQLRTSRADGSHVRTWLLPEAFQPAPGRGPRRNGSLEGLALAPDGRTAWLAMELPWRQDGPHATHAGAGAPVRITTIALDSGHAVRQFAYQPDAAPHPRRLPFGPELNGVSEILADGPHHLLVLERAYSVGRGFAARLYRVDTRTGSDTLELPALRPGNHTVAPKTLVADFAALGLAVDNLEGMAWGAPLASGACVLVLVSDDNFNPAQTTQFIAAQYRAPGGGNAACGTTHGP